MLEKQGIIILRAIPAVGENPSDGTTMTHGTRDPEPIIHLHTVFSI